MQNFPDSFWLALDIVIYILTASCWLVEWVLVQEISCMLLEEAKKVLISLKDSLLGFIMYADVCFLQMYLVLALVDAVVILCCYWYVCFHLMQIQSAPWYHLGRCESSFVCPGVTGKEICCWQVNASWNTVPWQTVESVTCSLPTANNSELWKSSIGWEKSHKKVALKTCCVYYWIVCFLYSL